MMVNAVAAVIVVRAVDVLVLALPVQPAAAAAAGAPLHTRAATPLLCARQVPLDHSTCSCL